MKPDKEKYIEFVLNQIKQYFPSVNVCLIRTDIYLPLTSRKIAMNANDLLYLYAIISEKIKQNIILTDVYSFWSVNAIVELLMSYEDDFVYHIVLKGTGM